MITTQNLSGSEIPKRVFVSSEDRKKKKKILKDLILKFDKDGKKKKKKMVSDIIRRKNLENMIGEGRDEMQAVKKAIDSSWTKEEVKREISNYQDFNQGDFDSGENMETGTKPDILLRYMLKEGEKKIGRKLTTHERDVVTTWIRNKFKLSVY